MIPYTLHYVTMFSNSTKCCIGWCNSTIHLSVFRTSTLAALTAPSLLWSSSITFASFHRQRADPSFFSRTTSSFSKLLDCVFVHCLSDTIHIILTSPPYATIAHISLITKCDVGHSLLNSDKYWPFLFLVHQLSSLAVFRIPAEIGLVGMTLHYHHTHTLVDDYSALLQFQWV